jgi:hypothetical protein
MITPGSRLAERTLRIHRANETTAPCNWRDCRLCMSVGDFDKRAILKGEKVLPDVGSEDIHAWHTDDEIIQFLNRQVR